MWAAGSPYEFSLYGADFEQRHIMHREILDVEEVICYCLLLNA